MHRPADSAARGGPGVLRGSFWVFLLALPLARAMEAEETYVELDFFQGSFSSEDEAGEDLMEFNREEILHVDWAHKEKVWRLPDFTGFTDFQKEGLLGNIAVMKNNLGILMRRSNWTRAQNVAPLAKVYPRKPVELGEPNVLICFVDRFSPPVLNITWLKNGQVVLEGVQETGFLSSVDYTFRKFSYLPFVPEEGDLYACQVDHWGLQESLTRLWEPKKPTPTPRTTENVVCGLGLLFGLLGIIVGPLLFLKARQRNQDGPRHKGGSRGGI